MLCRLKILVSWLIVSLVIPASLSGAAEPPGQLIGAAEKVVGEVYGNSLLRRLKTDEKIFKDQRVKAGVDSAADLRFLDQSRLTVGPKSEIVLDKFVYDPDAKANQGTVKLVRGVLRFTSASLDRDVKFETPSVTIGIRGTIIDLMVTDRSTEVVVHEGRVQVTGKHGSVFLNEGETLTVTQSGPARSNQGSPKIQKAVSEMLAHIGGQPNAGSRNQKAQQPGQTQDGNESKQRADGSGETASNAPLPYTQRQSAGAQNAKPTPPRANAPDRNIAREAAAIAGKNPKDLLYLDLPHGRVIIEMRPDLAPHHIARIKELVRTGFYDGLKFHSVIPSRFAMTGDPTGTGRGGSGKDLSAEFSPESFRRGSVGMAHDRGKPDSADSQFFVSLQAFPEIDGKYTLWGQVIHGMEFIDQLRAGNPPASPDTILRAYLAADVAG